MKFYKIFSNIDEHDQYLIILYVNLEDKTYTKDFFVIDSNTTYSDLKNTAKSELEKYYQSLTNQEVTQ